MTRSRPWWRANRVLDANADKDADNRANKGGRPVAQPGNWISGVPDCPECGGKLYVNAGLTPAVDYRTGKPRAQKPRTPRLRCGGPGKALDALRAERKSIKARIEGFELIPDDFDYAPTGQTLAGMWERRERNRGPR